MARLVFKVKVRGLENLPKSGNFVLTPNHSSMLDAPAIASVLSYGQMQQLHWAAARDVMFTNSVTRLASRMGQVLPIDRYGAGTGIKNMALAMTALQRQKNLVWFPEGRISTTDKMLPFREGIGIVLNQSGVPVVPVLIEGTRQAMPAEAVIPKPAAVTVTFGPPCNPHDLAGEGEGETAPARIVSALQQRVADLRMGE